MSRPIELVTEQLIKSGMHNVAPSDEVGKMRVIKDAKKRAPGNLMLGNVVSELRRRQAEKSQSPRVKAFQITEQIRSDLRSCEMSRFAGYLDKITALVPGGVVDMLKWTCDTARDEAEYLKESMLDDFTRYCQTNMEDGELPLGAEWLLDQLSVGLEKLVALVPCLEE